MATKLYLVPATSRNGARRYLERTVLTGVERDFYSKFTESDLDGRIRVWGLISSMKTRWEIIDKSDWFLFYTKNGEYEYAAQVAGKENNKSLGDALRKEILHPDPDEDRDWNLLVFFQEPVPVTISGERVQELFDYRNQYPVRFTRVINDRLDSLRAEYGNVDKFIDAISDN